MNPRRKKLSKMEQALANSIEVKGVFPNWKRSVVAKPVLAQQKRKPH